jgi:hypothetical protein
VLTLLSVPKPFCDRIGIIQTNALQSWLKLSPTCEVILFGDEYGTAATAAQFKVLHRPGVRRNEFGTPLLNDLLETAQEIASHELICFVNADVILMQDFIASVKSVCRLKASFLMVGRRWNIDLHRPFAFESQDWDENLRLYAKQHGNQGSEYYIDYFVFPKGLFKNLPPFAIGRAAFDNWLLWKARSSGAIIVDASDMVVAVHQNHDYVHHPQGRDGVYLGPEAKRNQELMGGSHHLFTLDDATHFLTPSGLKRNLSRRYFRRKWKFFRRALRHRWRERQRYTGNSENELR